MVTRIDKADLLPTNYGTESATLTGMRTEYCFARWNNILPTVSVLMTEAKSHA